MELCVLGGPIATPSQLYAHTILKMMGDLCGWIRQSLLKAAFVEIVDSRAHRPRPPEYF